MEEDAKQLEQDCLVDDSPSDGYLNEGSPIEDLLKDGPAKDSSLKVFASEVCPNCGKSIKRGSLTSWIFGGPRAQACSCAITVKRNTPDGRQTTSHDRRAISSGQASIDKVFTSIKHTDIQLKEDGESKAEIRARGDKFITSRYSVRNLIGVGGMGSVYKAEDKQLKKTFAIKVLRPDLSRDPLASRRFNPPVLRSLRGQGKLHLTFLSSIDRPAGMGTARNTITNPSTAL